MIKPMVIRCVALGVFALCGMQAQAQDRIYRCGNEYTNRADVAKAQGCVAVAGGNVTVVQGTAVSPSSSGGGTAERARGSGAAPGRAASVPVASRGGADRVDQATQRARDSDAQAILETELRKAQERLAQAQREYANGAPPKQGVEVRNHQTYLSRVAELKAAMDRAQTDVDGIGRELSRLGGGTGGAAERAVSAN